MHELTISHATRGALGEAVARARYAGEPTVLLVHGKRAAVVVSLEDAALLRWPTRDLPPEPPKS